MPLVLLPIQSLARRESRALWIAKSASKGSLKLFIDIPHVKLGFVGQSNRHWKDFIDHNQNVLPPARCPQLLEIRRDYIRKNTYCVKRTPVLR
jgi:hypothetical protein